MKFLIIRFSSIGDIVLTTPVIRCLKKQVADAEVHMVTKSAFKSILENNPYIDKLHVLENSIDDTIAQLQQESFDVVIDLHRNIRTLKVKKALGVKSFSFNKLNVRKWMLTNFKINTLPPMHIVDRYMDTVKSFGVVNDDAGLDYFIPAKDQINQHDLPLPHQVAYVAVVIGAAHATKKLPVDQLKQLCGLLNFPVVLLGGKEDRNEGDEIAAVAPEKIYNACGKFNLNESAGLVKNAKLIISHDTGLMHIAAAFKKPVITIWGNTIPAFGMSPYFGRHAVWSQSFEVHGLSCRPCSKIGYDACPRKHFKCMRMQPVEGISKTAMSFLKP